LQGIDKHERRHSNQNFVSLVLSHGFISRHRRNNYVFI